jgi:hypothetical protein
MSGCTKPSPYNSTMVTAPYSAHTISRPRR